MSIVEDTGLVPFMEGERCAADLYRRPYEKIWLDAYRAFYSEYDPETTNFREGGSRVYYGLTRQKCLTAWNRETDILFNRPGLPWKINPTPIADIPALRVVNWITDQLPQELKYDVSQVEVEQLAEMIPTNAYKEAIEILAEEASQNMTEAVSDVWVEDKTSIKIKQGLLEKVITGTCVVKFGTCERQVNRWDAGPLSMEYKPQDIVSPTARWVSIFDVWPDPHARLLVDNGTIEGCDYVYERHQYTTSQMAGLIDKPMFISDNIREVLREGPNSKETQSDNTLGTLRGSGSLKPANTRYDVYERTGFLSVEQLQSAGVEVEGEDYDSLNVNIWYCGNHIIKVVKVPDKVTKLPYFFVPHEILPGELYGMGIPYKGRHGQALLNSAVRLFIDNKANASGPLIFINRDRWEDSDSPEELLKPWGVVPVALGPTERITDVVKFAPIPDVSAQLVPLINLAKHQLDEETGISAFSHAAQNKELTRATGGTAMGMSMIMGAADLSHKASVKSIDEFLIQPLITAFYNWFMQFSPDEELKGDMNVVALGTMGVMQKELISQRLAQVLTQMPKQADASGMNMNQMFLDFIESIDLDPARYSGAP